MSDYYAKSGVPSTSSSLNSSAVRAEFTLISNAFDKLPALSGNGSKFLRVNAGGTAVEALSASSVRTALDLVVGTNVQAYDAELAAIAGLVSAADRGIYFTGSGAASLFTLTAAGRALLDDAAASDQRTTLGLGTMATQASSNVSITGGTISLADGVLTRPEIIDYAETLVAHGNMGTTETIDLEGGNVHSGTMDDNCTFTFSNPSATGKACSFTLILTQDATGSRTATWPAAVKWPGGTAPTLSTGANDVDVLAFFTLDAGTIWRGVVCGQDFS
jgi:hypothetical protein